MSPPTIWSDSYGFTRSATSEVASKFGASRQHVSATVTTLFGKPLKLILIEKQLAYAATLLEVTPLPVPEIAFAAAFGHPSTFFRLFERAFGMTPAKYRRKARA